MTNDQDSLRATLNSLVVQPVPIDAILAKGAAGRRRANRMRLVAGGAAATMSIVAVALTWSGAGDEPRVDRALDPAVGSLESGSPTPDAQTPVPRSYDKFDGNPPVGIGESKVVTLNVHCGLKYLILEDGVWETAPQGGSSAPAGLPELITGTATRVGPDELLFKGEVLKEEGLVFTPAPAGTDAVCF